MPDFRRVRCAKPPKGCGQSSEDVGEISWSGLCSACGERRLYENIAGLFEKSGPAYDHWMRRSFMAARRRLLDAHSAGP